MWESNPQKSGLQADAVVIWLTVQMVQLKMASPRGVEPLIFGFVDQRLIQFGHGEIKWYARSGTI